MPLVRKFAPNVNHDRRAIRFGVMALLACAFVRTGIVAASSSTFARHTLNSTASIAGLLPGHNIVASAVTPTPAVIIVNSSSDVVANDGLCTLREAITSANTKTASGVTAGECNAGDSSSIINFSVTGTINLTGALPDLSTDISISGPGANLLTVRRDTGGVYRVFTVSSGATVNISGLTVSNGRTPDGHGGFSDSGNGGGVFNAGTLNLTEMTVSGNLTGNGVFTDSSTANWRGGFGGGIANTGTLNLTGVTVSGNLTGTSDQFSIGGRRPSGGNGGGIFNSGTMAMTNSTVSGNKTGIGVINGRAIGDAGDGGAVANVGSLTVTNSTLTANSTGDISGTGGGINCSPQPQPTLTGTAIVGNSIVAGNSGSDVFGAIDTQGHNIIQNTSGATFSGNTSTDIIGQDPKLGPLANNGGPTQTHMLLVGSPAIDAGSNALAKDRNNSALTTDQRGDGFPRIVNAGVDIGAVEFSYSISATAGTPQSAAINTAFTTQLQVTVNNPGNPVSGIPVTFTAPTTGASGTFQGTGTNTVTVNTNSSGVATAPVFNANSTAGGPYNVVASLGTGSPSVNFSLTNLKGNQTIAFGTLGDRRFGSLDFPLSATASSGLAVSFAVSGQCTLSGSTVHITGAGSCSVTASQAGDSNYNAAASVTQSFQIRKVSTFIFLHTSANPSTVGQEVTFSATVQLDSLLPSSPTAVPTGTVQFQVDQHDLGGPVNCAPGGGNNCTTSGVSTSTLTAGDHGITANYSGDANFNPSTIQIPQTVAAVVIEFSQSSYTVAERDGSITITVKRTGDTTQAASVDYSTDDGSTPSVAAPCSAVTGQALERCDYTRAAGTLNFAPNETQKSFNVLVGDDSYAEGTEALSLRLSNPSSNAALGQSATLHITDDQPESSGNPNDDAQTFVRQHYHDFLNREPDASGLQFWTNQMTNCGASNSTVCHVNVSAAFFLSIEFQQTGFLVERMYKVSYGDAQGTSSLGGTQHPLLVPVVRFSEFLRDTQEIGQGVVVGQGDWQRQLESNKQAFALDFVQRQRFTTAFPTTQTPAQFVDALFQNAGITPSANERSTAIGEFGSASDTSDTSARARALRDVAENASFSSAEFDRAFVLMQYFGYLRRNPNDAPDSDYTGYDFWLQKLDQFQDDFVKAEMVKAFIQSDEYRHRFGQ